jgi:hypothetical protein
MLDISDVLLQTHTGACIVLKLEKKLVHTGAGIVLELDKQLVHVYGGRDVVEKAREILEHINKVRGGLATVACLEIKRICRG